MATRTPTVTKIDDNTVKFVWTGLTKTTDDVGAPISAVHADYMDRTVHVTGTMGAAGNLRIAGSNDGGANYSALNDSFGTALNITTLNAVKAINENPLFTRPEVTAGENGVTDITVTIIARRNRSGKAN